MFSPRRADAAVAPLSTSRMSEGETRLVDVGADPGQSRVAPQATYNPTGGSYWIKYWIAQGVVIHHCILDAVLLVGKFERDTCGQRYLCVVGGMWYGPISLP